jgi:serine/threonine protein kinase
MLPLRRRMEVDARTDGSSDAIESRPGSVVRGASGGWEPLGARVVYDVSMDSVRMLERRNDSVRPPTPGAEGGGDGYVVLTDFAWCEDIGPEATATDPNTVKLTLVHKATQYGTTPEYAAPEVIDRDGSTVASDWWSLGVLLYEFVAGILPFTGQSMTELQAAIIGTQVRIPDFFSAELKSLISKLLERHPEQRLQRLQDLFAHPFFKGLAQGRVVSGDTKPEFVPELANAVEVKYFAPAVTQLPIPSYLDQPTDPRDLSHLAGYVYPRYAVDTVGDAAVAAAADGGR